MAAWPKKLRVLSYASAALGALTLSTFNVCGQETSNGDISNATTSDRVPLFSGVIGGDSQPKENSLVESYPHLFSNVPVNSSTVPGYQRPTLQDKPTLLKGDYPELGHARHVYFLIIGDASAGGIGPQTQRGADAFEGYLNEMFLKDPDRPERKSLITIKRMGNDGPLSPETVREYYRNLRSTSNDVKVFFYSGHGTLNLIDGNVLTMSGGSMTRSELRVAMESAPGRKNIILTDSCNSLPQPPRFETEELSKNTARDGLMQDLFFRGLGTVDITASSPGVPAWYDPNMGIFTASLLNQLKDPDPALDSNHDGFTSWSEMFHFVQKETDRRYVEFRQELLAIPDIDKRMDRRDLKTLRSMKHQIPFAYTLPCNQKLSDNVVLVSIAWAQNWKLGIRRGMLFDAQLYFTGLESREAQINVYFQNSQKAILRNTGVNSSRNGSLAISTGHFSVTADKFFIDRRLFLPYDEVHAPAGETITPILEMFVVDGGQGKSLGGVFLPPFNVPKFFRPRP